MNMCGLIATGLLATIAGICAIIAGIAVLVYGALAICNEAAVNNPDADVTLDECKIGVNGYAGIAFVGGAMWLVVALLVFVFSCGDRYKNLENSDQAAVKTNEAQVVGTKADEQPGTDDNA
jgi:hypothetical protein